MKKAILFLAILGFQYLSAQEETKDPIFNMGPMVRLHGIYPINFGDNYLADSNDSKVSFGINLSLFEVYGFRLTGGIDHLYYNTNNVEMAADVSRTKYTAVYGLLSYEIPITQVLSVQPYLGGGWTNLNFKRQGEITRSNFYADFEDIGVSNQEGAEFRAGFYLDYKVAKVVSVFTGVNYIRGSYNINTAAEFEDYFGESSMVQISLGLKIGYTLRDKRKDKAAGQPKIQ